MLAGARQMNHLLELEDKGKGGEKYAALHSWAAQLDALQGTIANKVPPPSLPYAAPLPLLLRACGCSGNAGHRRLPSLIHSQCGAAKLRFLCAVTAERFLRVQLSIVCCTTLH